MTVTPIKNIKTGEVELYHAVIKSPYLYIQALGKTRAEAIDRALLEYFRPF